MVRPAPSTATTRPADRRALTVTAEKSFAFVDFETAEAAKAVLAEVEPILLNGDKPSPRDCAARGNGR